LCPPRAVILEILYQLIAYGSTLKRIWLTKLFNDNLAPAATSSSPCLGLAAQARPWANFITMQILVVLDHDRAVSAAAFGRLSWIGPSKTQQTFEVIYEFVNGESEDQIGHDAHKYFRHISPRVSLHPVL
jgi:F0F1-type ATP synthase membrane subunit a